MPDSTQPRVVSDLGADRWSGRTEKLSQDQWVKRAQDALKQSDWLEAARCAGIAQVMLRSKAGRGGVVTQYVAEGLPKAIAKAAPHLTASQAACLEAWFGPTPEYWRTYGTAMVNAKRWDEARAQALAILARFPDRDAANGAEAVLLNAHVAAPQDIPAGTANSVFRVALLIPQMGDYEAYGKSLRCGMEIAIAEYNARVSLPIRLGEYETEGEGWRAASAGKRAMDEGAGILVGDVLTVPTFVLAGLANQAGIPLLSPSATDPRVGAAGPMVFQTGAPLEAQARALARYVVKNDKRRMIAAPANFDTTFLNPFSAEVKQL